MEDKCPYERKCNYKDELCKTDMYSYEACVFFHAFEKYQLVKRKLESGLMRKYKRSLSGFYNKFGYNSSIEKEIEDEN